MVGLTGRGVQYGYVFEGDSRRGHASQEKRLGRATWVDSCPAGRALGDGDVIWMGLMTLDGFEMAGVLVAATCVAFAGQDAGALLQCSGTCASCCCCEGWAGNVAGAWCSALAEGAALESRWACTQAGAVMM